jgi:DNA-binding transcriptional LysR family regulator
MLLRRLAGFRALHQGIELQLVVNNRFSSLTRREADVALRGSNEPPGHLLGRLAGRMETALYASRAYWRTARGIREPTAHTWVAPDDTLAHLAQARWVAANVPAERIALRVDSLSAMVDAVRSGVGVGFLLCFLGDREKDLVQVAAPMASLDTQLWVLAHPDLKRVARIRAFTEYLYQSLAKDAHVLPPRKKP